MMFSSMPSMMVKVTAILTYWVLILYCFDITYALCSMVAYGKNGSYFWFLCWNTLQIRQSDCFSLTWQFYCFSKACHDNISITHYTIKQQCCLCLCYTVCHVSLCPLCLCPFHLVQARVWMSQIVDYVRRNVCPLSVQVLWSSHTKGLRCCCAEQAFLTNKSGDQMEIGLLGGGGVEDVNVPFFQYGDMFLCMNAVCKLNK